MTVLQLVLFWGSESMHQILPDNIFTQVNQSMQLHGTALFLIVLNFSTRLMMFILNNCNQINERILSVKSHTT